MPAMGIYADALFTKTQQRVLAEYEGELDVTAGFVEELIEQSPA